jgi:hypothetical protein
MAQAASTTRPPQAPHAGVPALGSLDGMSAVVAAVLVAAVLHASWNAMLKGGRDRLVLMVLLDLTAVMLSLFLLLLARPPAPASWGLLALSVSLHTGYKLLLLQSYRVGDLNQVYALAVRGRGLAVGARAQLGVGVVAGSLACSATGWCCGPRTGASSPSWPPCARPACWSRP